MRLRMYDCIMPPQVISMETKEILLSSNTNTIHSHVIEVVSLILPEFLN
jgi:hypothetical protein